MSKKLLVLAWTIFILWPTIVAIHSHYLFSLEMPFTLLTLCLMFSAGIVAWLGPPVGGLLLLNVAYQKRQREDFVRERSSSMVD